MKNANRQSLISNNIDSLNIFVDGDTTPGPVYFLAGKDGGLNEYECREENFKNEKGHMQIFPSSTYHKVDPVSSERISFLQICAVMG